MNPCPPTRALLQQLAKASTPALRKHLTTSTILTDSGKDKGGFFGSFFDRKIETQESSHSAKFASAREEIIELQTHNVKPDSLERYLDAHKNLVDYINAQKEGLHCEALGNFR